MFEEIFWWWQVGEERAPRSQLCLAGTLDDDVEVIACRERCLEEGNDGGEKWPFTGIRLVGFACAGFTVNLLVEDVMEEDFKTMGEVGEVREVSTKREGCRGAQICETVLEEVREEKVCLTEC